MSLSLEVLHRLGLFLFAITLFSAVCPRALLAEEVDWSGDDAQLVDVRMNGLNRKALAPALTSPNNNIVRVENTTQVPGYVIGGYVHTPDGSPAGVSGNTVIMGDGVDVQSGVYGGYAASNSGQAESLGNRIRSLGATIRSSVYGGYAWTRSGSATASGNEVIIDGGSVSDSVRGGYVMVLQGTGTAIVEGNSVSLKNVTVSSRSYGGYAYSPGGQSIASGNTFFIGEGVKATWVVGGNANSANGLAVAEKNRVEMSGGEVQKVLGGYSITDNSPALAAGNSALITGGRVAGDVIGGQALKNQGRDERKTTDISATDNHVGVSGGTINGDVYGSRATCSLNTRDSGGVVYATASSVAVSGGMINGNIYGGYAARYYVELQKEPLGRAVATHNSVTLSGSPVFGGDTRLYGGNGLGDADVSDYYTGNTLNVLDYYGSSRVAGIANFQNYNFLVPASLASGSAYLQSGELDLGASPHLLGVAVTAGRVLPDGHSVDLIRSDTTISGGRINESILVPQGALVEYDGFVTTTDTALNLTLRNPRTVAGAEAVAGGAAASVALSVQGAHVLATNGVAAAVAAAERVDSFATFGTMEGGSSRYTTGSHVDVTGGILLVGAAAQLRIGNGLLVVGPAFEASYADFEGHIGSARGSGYGRSYGGALLGRYQHDSGVYLDASLRAGLSFLSYNSGLQDSSGRSASYESEVPYYGLHVGPGCQWRMTEKAALELSAAYLWTHVEGSTESMGTGERVRFEDADSHILHGDARLSYEVAQGVKPYVGASYEYELDGDTRSGAYGHSFRTLSLEGGTGMGEAGLYWNIGPVFIDAGVQGYNGVREGFGGSLMARFEF